jgi:rhamnulokinase
MDLHLAIDLGAGSGRAILGRLAHDGLTTREVHRFHYPPRVMDGRLRWDAGALFGGVRQSLQRAGAAASSLSARVTSAGVDSWGVDYALVDANGRLVEEPVCYRDARAAAAVDEVLGRLGREALVARTGIQFLPFNTVFQLAIQVRDGLHPNADRMLMIPDVCHQFLCGSTVTERTNASTTQMLRAGEMVWDDEVCAAAGVPRRLLPDIVEAATVLGPLDPRLQAECALGPLEVIAPATHDTGSAVAGTPLQRDWAYVSSGTWSLVGVESPRPLITSDVAAANFTNEAGVFGTVRFLKNVMGLWILESCRREWNAAGLGLPYDELLERTSRVTEFPGFIFPDDPRFFNPLSMVAAVREQLTETGQEYPTDPVLLTKVILDSLAMRYASVVRTIERVTGRPVPGIHIVGGGSLNDYLNQATADAADRPVTAGPSEATAIGNLLVQSIAAGEIGSLSEARRLLAAHLPLKTFAPMDPERWTEASDAYSRIEAVHA